jgi:SAM-dependent methyltransferase
MSSPVLIYEAGLAGADAVTVRLGDGTQVGLPLGRYLGPAGPVDESLLADVTGPVLDVGCGPGRHLHALARRGVFALGVDLSEAAVGLARGGGANAIVGSIFGDVPGVGTWRTALLLDGNIGIGGAPDRLLRRIAALLGPGGEIVVELDPPGTPTGTIRARLEASGSASSWFPWARVASGDIGEICRTAGAVVMRRWAVDGRWFAQLRAPGGRS